MALPMGPERLEGPSPPGGQRVHLCLKRQGWGDERQGAREHLALTFLVTSAGPQPQRHEQVEPDHFQKEEAEPNHRQVLEV